MSAPLPLAAVKSAIRAGRFSAIGSYPLYLVMADGEALCPGCARSEFREIARAHIFPGCGDSGWEVAAHGANWEDPDLYCAHCNDRIESAYAEPDTDTDAA